MKEKTPEAILDETIQSLQSGWIQGFLAKDEQGDATTPVHSSATQWCLVGALCKSAGLQDARSWAYPKSKSMDKVIRWIGDITGEPCLTAWNDTEGRTQEEVIGVLETVRHSRIEK